MLKKPLAATVAVSASLLIISNTAAKEEGNVTNEQLNEWEEEDEEEIQELTDDEAEVDIRTVEHTEEDLQEKQAAIDEEGFEYEDFSIVRSGTDLSEMHVEVGIDPYSENNASKIYGQFGDEIVHVVEGEQKETMVDADKMKDSNADDRNRGDTTIFQRAMSWFTQWF